MVEPVQKNAQEIKESAREIHKHLAQFQASLSNDSNTESLSLFKNAQTESDSLKRMIKLIPSVTKTNHAETYLRKQRETLALGTGMDLSSVAGKSKVQASLKDKK